MKVLGNCTCFLQIILNSCKPRRCHMISLFKTDVESADLNAILDQNVRSNHALQRHEGDQFCPYITQAKSTKLACKAKDMHESRTKGKFDSPSCDGASFSRSRPEKCLQVELQKVRQNSTIYFLKTLPSFKKQQIFCREVFQILFRRNLNS